MLLYEILQILTRNMNLLAKGRKKVQNKHKYNHKFRRISTLGKFILSLLVSCWWRKTKRYENEMRLIYWVVSFYVPHTPPIFALSLKKFFYLQKYFGKMKQSWEYFDTRSKITHLSCEAEVEAQTCELHNSLDAIYKTKIIIKW